MANVSFRPRRLGHVNLYASNLERSMEFYEKICGIEPVAIEEALRAGFHSNGNTHHDIGIIEVSRGVDRLGRDGKVQVAATRGTRPGLNHLGWEMENEVELVAGYRRLLAAGLRPTALYDHQISHAIYISDPDGNVHEFYADMMRDWRKVMNMAQRGLMTSQWNPLENTPTQEPNYDTSPTIRQVPAAPLHPRNTTSATFATHRFEPMKQFMLEVVGLALLKEERNDRNLRRAGFQAMHGERDLVLQEVREGEPTGYRCFALLLGKDTDLDAARKHLKAAGVNPVERVDDDGRRTLVLIDPDGMEVEFYRTQVDRAAAA